MGSNNYGNFKDLKKNLQWGRTFKYQNGIKMIRKKDLFEVEI